MSEWTKKDFVRRGYYIEGEPEGPIEVIVKIKGKTFAQLTMGEPGVLAIVSRPDENGFRIESVRPGAVRYTDVVTPESVSEQGVRDWEYEAMGVE